MNLEKYTTRNTFISSFMELCNVYATPIIFDLFAAISCISAVCTRRISVSRADGPIYLNTYVSLCSEGHINATRLRDLCEDILRDCCKDDPGYVHSFGSVTDRRLVTVLSERAGTGFKGASGYLLPTSLSALQHEALITLANLYGCPAIRSGGTLGYQWELRDVYLSMLSNASPDWVAKNITDDLIECGFAGCTLFVRAEKAKRVQLWGEDDVKDSDTNKHEYDSTIRQRDQHSEIREKATQQLHTIRTRALQCSNITITTQARRSLSHWRGSRRVYRDKYRASFGAHIDSHALSLAAILCIDRGAWEINADDILNAIQLVTRAREDGASMLLPNMQVPGAIKAFNIIRNKLITSGREGITHTTLLRAVTRYLNASEFNDAMEGMHELGMIQRFTLRLDNVVGRPSTIYRATKSIMSENAQELWEHRQISGEGNVQIGQD